MTTHVKYSIQSDSLSRIDASPWVYLLFRSHTGIAVPNLHSHFAIQRVDPQTIAIQTFLTIWRLKYLSKTISLIIVSAEFIIVIILMAIGYGIHTNPRNEYYVAPSPV